MTSPERRANRTLRPASTIFQPTRVGYKFLEDGRKVRVARRSGETIDI